MKRKKCRYCKSYRQHTKNIKIGGLGVVVAVLLLVGRAVGANAADITNLDGEPQTIQITQNGIRETQVIQSGQTVDICQNKPCFVLFPSETMLSVNGTETLNIRNNDVEITN